MNNTFPIVLVLLLAVSLWSCEQPESPDFQVDNQFEVPLTMEKTYPLLGANEALLDTTSEDFEDLFLTDSEGLVHLAKEEDVDFGDLNNAIPEISVEPTTVNSEVGELELTNFNSSGNVGSASFEDVTGFTSPLSEGDPVPGGSTPSAVKIDFSADYFESAIIKENGSLEITLSNNLGFDIDEINITLNSGSNSVSSTTIGDSNSDTDNFNHNTTETTTLDISASTVLEDLNVDITASWESQTMQDDAGGLTVNDVGGQDLVASEVTAAIESQSFNNSGTSTVDNSSFEFQNENHFVELSDGELTLDITNNIDIGIDNLDITFPDIRDSNGDPLVIDLSDMPRDDTFNYSYDLSDYSIYAENNSVQYDIDAQTENTQQGSGSETRTITEDDELTAEVDINNLQINRAEGVVKSKEVLLNEDQNNDQNIDVFNDEEADITQIDGLGEISDQISDVIFENPALNILYDANLGVPTTIYAVIAGTDQQGNTEFLHGLEGTDYRVESSEIPSQLQVNGQQANEDQVIKFDLSTAENPDPAEGEPGSNDFNADNSTTSDFFSNLPSDIRFVGVAQVNEKEDPGVIVNPVIFDPSFGVEIPFNLSANNASYQDTVDADFSDLPEGDGDTSLSEAMVTINYTNGLPLDLTLNVIMLDANGDEVASKNDIAVTGASTDDNGFVSDLSQNDQEVSFSDSEMNNLHQTRSMVMDININTPEQQSVSIRGDDAVTFKVKVRAGITSTVN
ncbi:MAG: hypothetical protein ACQEST_07670 [Bacteroidota bacterium]